MAKKMKGQLSLSDLLFEELENQEGGSVLAEATFVRDIDCNAQTPVVFGEPVSPIYGSGIGIKPRVPGRRDSDHFKEIYLPELLPLEEYDKIIVLFSGGKDSLCAVLNLLELGVPKEKIELWHHDIDWSERDIWECMKRHNINPHPCYRTGWNRCSCAMCIFSTPKLFAGIKELYPEEFEALVQDEKILGFTLDNKCDLNTFVGNEKSCVVRTDKEAIESLLTGQYTPEQIYVKGEWHYPAGAFHGAAGGPC